MNALAPVTDATVRRFLADLWGADDVGNLPGVGIIAAPQSEGFRHFYVRTNAEALAHIGRLNKDGIDVYFAISQYKEPTSRQATNVLGARSFWLDIDCGEAKAAEGKGYATQTDAFKALFQFGKETKLPKPTYVVSSGNGLHVYWVFDGLIPAKDWREAARKFKGLVKARGFRADPMRTADITSLLRVPGTSNFKDRQNPKPVKLWHAGEKADLNAFLKALDAPSLGAVEIANGAMCAGDSNLRLPPPPETPEEIVKVRSMLAAIPPDIDRAEWRDVVWALQATGWTCAAQMAREWSQQGKKWNADDFAGVVKSYDPNKMDGIHFGTLVHSAKKYGWTPPATEVGAIREGEIIGPGEASPDQLATLADFNGRFFVSMIGGGCFIFDEQAENPIATAMSEASFKLRFKNVRSGDISLAATWLSWPGRRTFEAVDFDPRGECAPGVFNSYRGLAVKPREGSCDLILAHIRDVLCGGDDAQFHYVIRWLALLVQRPWGKPEVALVFRSREGAGKSIIAGILLKIFGQHGFTTASKDAVAGRFNAHLRDKIVVVLEEAFFAGDPQAVAAAKVLVTNESLSYEAKGKDAVTGRNFAHVIMMTNHDWAVPASEDARRWAVLDVSDSRVGDHAYFERLVGQIKNGGDEAFLDLLLKIDLEGFNPRKLPKTAALADQRKQTLLHDKPVEAWILDALSSGEFPLKDGISLDWVDEIDAALLRSSYEYATARKPKAPIWSQAMARLRVLMPAGSVTKRRPRDGDLRRTVYLLPPIEEARAKFREVTGVDPAPE